VIEVPPRFVADAEARAGAAGRAWAVGLPAAVQVLAGRWGLTLDGAPMRGYLGLVVPVRRGDEPCVLKLSWLDESNAHEALALEAWRGRGAVRLLAADKVRGALLLERLDGSRSLEDVPADEAVATAGRLLRRLAIAAPPGLPSLDERATRLAADLPARWAQAGQPFARAFLDCASSLAIELGSTSQPLLTNHDLHYGNVLAATREPWLVIDPKPLAGDPEYALAPLIWRRSDDLTTHRSFDRRLAALVEAADLDAERARGWALVRTLDYWLWALSVGLTDDPARCRRLADWLAT
jgi:streptomycin 6-kinase